MNELMDKQVKEPDDTTPAQLNLNFFLQSGFVIKTVRLSDNMKVFLNICTSPDVTEYSIKKVKGRDQLSLPHTISPVRDDLDKGISSNF